MKALIPLSLLTAAAIANPDYAQTLFQTEYDSLGKRGLTYQVPVGKEGSRESIEHVTFRSHFILECTSLINSKTTEIGDVFVDGYAPLATVSIESSDPYVDKDTGMRRTRIDMPFSVKYKVDGLRTSDPKAPTAAKKVRLFEKKTILKTNSMDADPDETVSDVDSDIERNETKTDTKNANKDILPTGKNGVLSYRFETYADGNIAGYTLGSPAEIQVIGLSTGSISGVDPKKSYKVVPDLKLSITDAYPGSETYLVVKTPSGKTIKIDDKGVLKNTKKHALSQTWEVSGDELDDHEAFSEIGVHTVILVTETSIHGPENKAETPLDMEENVVTVKGMITAAE